jgi:hypothetical protein
MTALTSVNTLMKIGCACSGRNAGLIDEMTLPSAGHVDTGVSSPGVQTSATGTFSPLLSVSIAAADGSIHSPLDAGSYASADAARVGGGLYKHLLQAACTLATDPAPKVARLGKAALRVADVELAPVSVTSGWFSVAHMHAVHLQYSMCICPAGLKQTILTKSCRPSLSEPLELKACAWMPEWLQRLSEAME